MKRLLRPLAGLPLIWSAACASLPGVQIVEPPPALTVQSLPPPPICLLEPAAPQALPAPTLPEAVSPPLGEPRETVFWWRGVAAHFESRARRAEMTQAYAVNVADAERTNREANAVNAAGCALILRTRDLPAVG